MDILFILFLVFGWIFNIKGLIITSLVLSAILLLIQILRVAFCDLNKKQTAECRIGCFVDFVGLGLSIVKLCLM